MKKYLPWLAGIGAFYFLVLKKDANGQSILSSALGGGGSSNSSQTSSSQTLPGQNGLSPLAQAAGAAFGKLGQAFVSALGELWDNITSPLGGSDATQVNSKTSNGGIPQPLSPGVPDETVGDNGVQSTDIPDDSLDDDSYGGSGGSYGGSGGSGTVYGGSTTPLIPTGPVDISGDDGGGDDGGGDDDIDLG